MRNERARERERERQTAKALSQASEHDLDIARGDGSAPAIWPTKNKRVMSASGR